MAKYGVRRGTIGVRRSPDRSRMAAAASRPGIDPRIWITDAVVTEVGYDAEEGIFADIVLPTGETDTCYLGQPYAGSRFGFHFPVEVDDTVLVGIPMGDSGAGPVIISRWHNAGDPPNSELGSGDEPTKDVVLRVKNGQRFVLRTSGADVDIKVEGSGSVNIEAAGDAVVTAGGTVKLGDGAVTAPLQGALNGETIDPFTGITFAALGQASTKVAVKK